MSVEKTCARISIIGLAIVCIAMEAFSLGIAGQKLAAVREKDDGGAQFFSAFKMIDVIVFIIMIGCFCGLSKNDGSTFVLFFLTRIWALKFVFFLVAFIGFAVDMESNGNKFGLALTGSDVLLFAYYIAVAALHSIVQKERAQPNEFV
jgi:hypothetical protein